MACSKKHGNKITIPKAKSSEKNQPGGQWKSGGPIWSQTKGYSQKTDSGPNEEEFPEPFA
jgi:hypothetical protein